MIDQKILLVAGVVAVTGLSALGIASANATPNSDITPSEVTTVSSPTNIPSSTPVASPSDTTSPIPEVTTECPFDSRRWQVASPGYVQVFMDNLAGGCSVFTPNLATLVQCSTVTEVWIRYADISGNVQQDWSTAQVQPVTDRNACPTQVTDPAPYVTLPPVSTTEENK